MKVNSTYKEVQNFLKTRATRLGITKKYCGDIDENYIKNLQALALPNTYFWVTDLNNLNIKSVSGVRKCLGYFESDFDLEDAIKIIYEPFRSFVVEYNKAFFEISSHPEFRKISILKNIVFSFLFVVRDFHNRLLLVNQNTRCLEVDENLNMVSTLNTFQIVGKYQNEPLILNPRLYHSKSIQHQHQFDKIEEKLIRIAHSKLPIYSVFSERELEILQNYSTNKSTRELAQELNITPQTIMVHNKRIIHKSKSIFPNKFNSTKDLALYLQKLRLL